MNRLFGIVFTFIAIASLAGAAPLKQTREISTADMINSRHDATFLFAPDTGIEASN
ncbi:hypothetical protein JOM56_006874 [Amanita muscaria]